MTESSVLATMRKVDFRLNGNVKIELNNNFNAMEQIRLNWMATADKSTTLELDVRVPYLFGTAVGTQTNLNIFKKDSVFVNTKLEERLYYQLTMNSNLGLNLSYENSNFVLDDIPNLPICTMIIAKVVTDSATNIHCHSAIG